jgi:hypothetical protein
MHVPVLAGPPKRRIDLPASPVHDMNLSRLSPAAEASTDHDSRGCRIPSESEVDGDITAVSLRLQCGLKLQEGVDRSMLIGLGVTMPAYEVTRMQRNEEVITLIRRYQ